MTFRGDTVWVHVGDDGKPVLDGDGRAEMKYREGDTKSYRPAPSNLVPATGAAAAASSVGGGGRLADAGAAPRPARTRARKSPPKPVSPSLGAAAIDVWTDGACSGNPGPMGIGVVVIDGGHRDEIGEYLGVGTNNIAELVAIERGLEVAHPRMVGDGGERRRVRVYSDSGYAIGLLSAGWKAKANQELVARIRAQLAALGAGAVEFVKVRGHAGVPENERCDALARQAITERPRRR